MLRLSAAYTDQPVLSLRTGSAVGHAHAPIFNPHTLKIEGWYCSQFHEKEEFILLRNEVRDIIPKGIVVNDHESLTHPEDLVRQKELIDLRFELLTKPVRTESGRKLGKVADYAVDDVSFNVLKLYVNPTLLKGLTQSQFIIDRNSIVEITDTQITVRDAVVPSAQPATLPAQA